MRSIDHRRITESRRQFILDREGHQCAYCMEDADQVDHILPWAFVHCDDVENLVAACWLCNLIAADHIFDDFNAKRDYILARREKMLAKRVVAVWTEAEVKELGRKLKNMVRRGAIVVDDARAAAEVADRLRGFGLTVTDRPVLSGTTQEENA